MDIDEFLGNVNNDECPFSNLKLSEDWKKLNFLDERSECPKCKKSRKYFCYSCLLPVPEIAPYVPRLQLPIKLDIIKHNREIDGKSTAVHAGVLAADQVTIYTYPCIPNYKDEKKVVLIFPSKNASPLQDIIYNLNSSEEGYGECEEKLKLLNKVVFVDSTWNQTKGILKDARLSGLPCAVLKPRLSQFWRHQKGSPRTHLATIEAIHQFFVEYQLAVNKFSADNALVASCRDADLKRSEPDQVNKPLYNGQYDNLMFFFRFMFDKIHNLYDHDSLMSYKRPVP